MQEDYVKSSVYSGDLYKFYRSKLVFLSFLVNSALGC